MNVYGVFHYEDTGVVTRKLPSIETRLALKKRLIKAVGKEIFDVKVTFRDKNKDLG